MKSQSNIIPGAEPVFKNGNADFAILLLHGFKATPYEMKEFGLFLHDQLDATVSIPLLPNHGVDYATLNKSKWQYWHNFVVEEYSRLKKTYQRVFIIGMSMGGALALRIAAVNNPVGIICIGTPYKLQMKTKLTYLLSLIKKGITDTSGPDIKNPEEKRKAVTLYSIPLVALKELIRMLEDSKQHYGKIKSPLFLSHSEHDHVIPYSNFIKLKSKLNSVVKKEHTFKNSYHIVPLDNDRHQLFEMSATFIKSLL